jgi:hypothetical protein
VFCGIVPNFASLVSETLREGWDWLDPFHHCVHYTPNVLMRELEYAGFVVETLATAAGDYGRGRPLEILARLRPNSDPAQREALLAQIENAGMGEEIRFFARKPPLARSSLAHSFGLARSVQRLKLAPGDSVDARLARFFAGRTGDRLIVQDPHGVLPPYADSWNGVEIERRRDNAAESRAGTKPTNSRADRAREGQTLPPP